MSILEGDQSFLLLLLYPRFPLLNFKVYLILSINDSPAHFIKQYFSSSQLFLQLVNHGSVCRTALVSLENIKITGIAAKGITCKTGYISGLFVHFMQINQSVIHAFIIFSFFYIYNMHTFYKILFSPTGFAFTTTFNLKSPD